MHWTQIYTNRLGRKVKLVGSTINCQPVWWQSDPANEMRHNPHVQSYVMATDQVKVAYCDEAKNDYQRKSSKVPAHVHTVQYAV